MSQITIHKYRDAATTPRGVLEQVQAITDAIKQRAFDLFQSRDGWNGSDLTDWLQAERETVWSPASELVENEKEFQARIALPGFDARDIDVSALPDALVVQAETTHNHEGKDGDVRFCEFSEKKLFRRIDLPQAVDVDKVTASVDRGVLQVTAPKTIGKKLGVAA